MTPDSKLVEKLGFRVTENGDVVNLTAKFLDAPELRELGSEKYARLALWNLCLELSERLERAEKLLEPRICVTPANELNMGILYEAEKEKKA